MLPEPSGGSTEDLLSKANRGVLGDLLEQEKETQEEAV